MCRFLGVVFTLIGVSTLLSAPGIALPGDLNIQSSNVLNVIPGQLEYPTADGVRDLFVGLVGLIAGLFPREQEIIIDMKAKEAQQKVTGNR